MYYLKEIKIKNQKLIINCITVASSAHLVP